MTALHWIILLYGAFLIGGTAITCLAIHRHAERLKESRRQLGCHK